MAVTKETINTLFERLDELNGQIDEIKVLVKETYSIYETNNDITDKSGKKSLKRGYKAHKEMLANKEEFELVDFQVSKIVDFLTEVPETIEVTE